MQSWHLSKWIYKFLTSYITLHRFILSNYHSPFPCRFLHVMPWGSLLAPMGLHYCYINVGRIWNTNCNIVLYTQISKSTLVIKVSTVTWLKVETNPAILLKLLSQGSQTCGLQNNIGRQIPTWCWINKLALHTLKSDIVYYKLEFFRTPYAC